MALRLDGAFIDGDDCAEHDGPWYASSLSTSRRIVEAAGAALNRHGVVIVAYPLRCLNYLYFRRRPTGLGHAMVVVSLRASMEAIGRPSRGRVLSAEELQRSAEMLEQGYGARPFSDFIVSTDVAELGETVETLVRLLAPLAV